MKRWVLFFVLPNLAAMGLFGQAPDDGSVPSHFKPRYAGTSVNTGLMFSPGFGSAYYFAPKISFQTTPRLFFSVGAGLVQYSLLPSQVSDLSPKRSVTGACIFAEGMYLLSERWSVNGSVMKNIHPVSSFRSPYNIPSEAMHIGVNYRVTPNVTIGAQIGYSNGSNNGFPRSYSTF
jgi:hypothetical protein